MSILFYRRLLALILVIFLLIPCLTIQAFSLDKNENTMTFDCESVILMEASTQTVLYEMNADKELPPASVTKIMTLLLVMEEIAKGNLNYNDTITASAYAASMGGSQIYLKEGEQMSALDLIKSVVIASANDAAVALAEHICGSEEAFVSKMNEKAKELGMSNTSFENTNGLDDTTTNHLTSARDIAIMSRELIKYEKILEFSSTWMDTIRNGEFGLTNTNRLVRFYKGATGLKTGSTDRAKFCVSATAKRGNMHLICVVMGAPSSDVRNAIATQLLNWGFANYELYEDEAQYLNPIKVNSGLENQCSISTKGFATVVSKGQSKNVKKTINLPQYIKAPIQKGDSLGYVEYSLNGEELGKSDIVSIVSVDKMNFMDLFVRILSKFLLK